MSIARILAATDFSPAGDRAVRAGVAIAHRERAALRIVHAAPPRRWVAGFWGMKDPLIDAAYSQAGAALQRVASTLAEPHELDVSTGLVTGVASRAITRAAGEFRADLIVVGARGEHETATHHPGLGGTAGKLVAGTPMPLLLVRNEQAGNPDTVLAAIDLSPSSAAVMEWARMCAASGRLHVFHAYEVPFAARLGAYGLGRDAIDVYSGAEHARRDRELAALLAAHRLAGSQGIVERGDAGSLLLQCIERLDASLVVLGKHVPRRRSTTAFGSVCRYVSTSARANVLVVPPAARLGAG